MTVVKPPKQQPIEVKPNGQRIYGRNDRGVAICMARLRRNPGFCSCPVIYLNGRCRFHGGKSPTGIESAAFKTGRFSKYRDVITPELLSDYERLVSDPLYFSLAEDIALARVRFREALKEENALDSEVLKKLVGQTGYAEEVLQGEYDTDDLEACLREIIGSVKTLVRRGEKAETVNAAQEHLRKLIDTENKRLFREQEQIPASRALFLVAALRESARLHVWALLHWLRDNNTELYDARDRPHPLRNIQNDLRGLLAGETTAINVDGKVVDMEDEQHEQLERVD